MEPREKRAGKEYRPLETPGKGKGTPPGEIHLGKRDMQAILKMKCDALATSAADGGNLMTDQGLEA